MKYLQQFVTTSLNVGGGIDASQTTGIVLQSLNNIDATKPSVACLSWADPLNTSVAEWVTYTSVNSTTNELQGVTRGAEGYSAKTHENTAVVAFPLSKAHVNELNDLLTSGSGAITATLDEDDMASNSATALATQQSIKAYVDDAISDAKQALLPVGSIVVLGVSTNPATLYGFGTWTAIAGRVIVGLSGSDTEFDTLNETGGAKTHTLTIAEMPSHNHTPEGGGLFFLYGTNNSQIGTTAGSGSGFNIGTTYTGGGGAHNNLQPYIVKYVWERTA